jgi:hypothetical protein
MTGTLDGTADGWDSGFAFVILDEYDDPNLPNLGAIRFGARAVAQLLLDHRFVDTGVNLVADGRSSSVRMALGAWRPSNRRLLFYWGGHGSALPGDGGIYLYCKETPLGDPDPANALSGRELGELLAKKRISEIVLIVDVCQAGGGAQEVVGAFKKTLVPRSFAGPLRPSLAVISSAEPGQIAQEAVFGPALLAVLKMGPPNDPSRTWWTEKDALITPEELVAALRITLHRRGARQLPDFDMTGTVGPFFPNPGFNGNSPDVEVYAKKQRSAWLPSDVREHFMAKFRGIDTADERGWYFTGREQPLRRIVTWLREADSGVLVVTGPPGCGKSAVLGRLAVLSDEGYRREAENAGALKAVTQQNDPGVGVITAGIHAKSKTLPLCMHELAAALKLPVPSDGWEEAKDLLEAVRREERSFTILVDALDEAFPSDQVSIAQDLIRGLGNIPNVRVLVGTRPDRANPDRPPADTEGEDVGPLLRILEADSTVQLGDDSEAIPAIADYVLHRLLDLAGSPYAGHAQQARLAGEAVATRSGGIFLFARLLARNLANRSEMLDLDSAEARQLLSGGVAEAFEADLGRYGPDEQRVRDLLTALAWAEGAGLPRRQVWLAVTNALAEGRRYEESDLAWVLHNAGAHLIESSEDGQTVYRLYHQAFNDYLRRGHSEPEIQACITDALLALVDTEGADE